MSKTKSKVSKGAEKAVDKTLSKVKNAGVTKAAQSPKAKSKQIAREIAAKEEKGQKKKKREPTPSSSESESDSDEEESSSSESESEEEQPAKNAVKDDKKAKAAESSSESDSSDEESDSDEEMGDADSSDSESDEEEAEKPAQVKKDAKNAVGTDEGSDSESDSDEEDEEASAKVAKGSSDDSDDSDDSEEDASSDSSDESDSESESASEEVEETKAPSKKRKAEEDSAAASKKSKNTEQASGESANLFVGNLSWNVDEEWLRQEFEEFGELSGVRIVTDRDSGRSRGFGYVEYTDAADAAKAFAAKKDAEIDGRTINLDYAAGRQSNNQQGGNNDRAQARARTFGDQVSPESDTLFVGNIPFSANEDSVRELFAEKGSILGIRLPTDPDSGRPKGFGYVQFSSVEEAREAYNELNGADLNGRPMRLDFSSPRPNNGGDSRGGRGGGFRGGDRGGRGGGFGRGGGDRGGRGGFGRGGGRGGGFGRGGRGGQSGGFNKNRGSIPEYQGKKVTF